MTTLKKFIFKNRFLIYKKGSQNFVAIVNGGTSQKVKETLHLSETGNSVTEFLKSLTSKQLIKLQSQKIVGTKSVETAVVKVV